MKLFLIALAFVGVAYAAVPSHWRLVEQIEHGREKTTQVPLNQIYYNDLNDCRAAGTKAKFTAAVANELPTLFDPRPYTHIITCIEYKQGEDTPIKTP